jgi:hypothetical protein
MISLFIYEGLIDYTREDMDKGLRSKDQKVKGQRWKGQQMDILQAV